MIGTDDITDEVVGTVVRLGEGVMFPQAGMRVGIDWSQRSCGACNECFDQEEDLCSHVELEDYVALGGFAGALI